MGNLETYHRGRMTSSASGRHEYSDTWRCRRPRQVPEAILHDREHIGSIALATP